MGPSTRASKAAFELLRGTAGYRRVAACMRDGADGVEAGPAPERRVRESMRRQGLRARRGRRPRRAYSSCAGEVGDRPANVPRERARARRALGEDHRLAHDFSADRPSALLVTDANEIGPNGFRVYLSPVVDCWDGCPASWSISPPTPTRSSATPRSPSPSRSSPRAPGPSSTPTAAPATARARGGGSATRRAPRGRCRAGRRARTTRAEGFFGTLKQEFPYSREWTGVTRDEFCAQLDDYMRWYVRGRPKGFRQGGRTRYEAPAARRRRLGVAVPPERCGIVA